MAIRIKFNNVDGGVVLPEGMTFDEIQDYIADYFPSVIKFEAEQIDDEEWITEQDLCSLFNPEHSWSKMSNSGS